MFPTYGPGIQQGYWDGNKFIAPPTQLLPQQNGAPAAIPLPTQGLLPQAAPLSQTPVQQGLLDAGHDSSDNSADVSSGPLGIGDVNGGVVGNLGTIGSVAGLATGVPGLGMLGAGISNAAKADAYGNDLSGLKDFDPSAFSGFVNDMSLGAFGQSVHDQARDAVSEHANQSENGFAGAPTAFGGKMSGRMSKQAKDQERGGATKNESKTEDRNEKEGFSDGSNGSSRVICTELYHTGMMTERDWRGDLEFTSIHLTDTHIRGYHLWAIPLVRLMRRHNRLKRFIRYFAQARANQIAYLTGDAPKPDCVGYLVRVVGEPLCWTIGAVLDAKDYVARGKVAKKL